jgi:hypothetical protein
MHTDKSKLSLQNFIESPLASVFGVITILTTLWGVVSIYKDVATWGGSRIAAFMIAILLGLLVIFVFVCFLRPSVHRQFYLPFGERYIFTKIEKTWEVDVSGVGFTTVEKTYVFFSKPEDSDLSDTIMGSHNLSLYELGYESGDSDVWDVEKIKENTQRIFWKPKTGKIEIGTPYTHRMKTRLPNPEGEVPAFIYTAVVAPVFILHFRLSLKSNIPIVQGIVYQPSQFQKFTNADEIARKGESIKRRKAPLPTVIDQNNLTWAVDNISAGMVYYIVLYFKGWQSKKIH